MMLFNRDAQDIFLDPKSVNLFLTHPPYFGQHSIEYGDPEFQIQNTEDVSIFHNKMITIVKNMSDALTDDGNIFIMVPDDRSGPKMMNKIINATNLISSHILIWDFEESNIDIGGSPTVLIYRLVKSDNAYQDPDPLKNYVIKLPWNISLHEYQHLGFTADAFHPELASIIISKYSKPGDVVGDLLGGTGTVAYAAKQLERDYVYNDVSTSQYNIAKARLT